VLIVLAGAIVWLRWPAAGDQRLRAFVQAHPSVPIVFTSRRGLASFAAAAPEGEGFVFPGQPLWQASEGRLRLLTPQGSVHELTWEQPLAGGKLIDVMSPTVSPDGQKILFAGRRGPPDAGHFRLYEVGIDGTGLRQLTGGPNDPGCTELPPMRYRGADEQTRLPDQERRRVDYDDVDPVSLGASGRVVFASSRTPDLGRGHTRRSTTLWIMNADGTGLRPLTGNRNNDRWPFLLANGYVAFSLWSFNPEVITADERDIRPYEPGLASATRPVDIWFGAFYQVDGGRLGALLKPDVSVWRPRALFNGRFAFMTSGQGGDTHYSAQRPLQVMQADLGALSSVPSARPTDQPLPRQGTHILQRGPAADQNGRTMSFATPSPCPPHAVVLAGAPYSATESTIDPHRYGIYLAADDWSTSTGESPSAAQVGLQLLFDDPELADAEPVAVYPRWVRGAAKTAASQPKAAPSQKMDLANGTRYEGPGGQVFNSDLYVNVDLDPASQQTDTKEGPIFAGPPAGSIDDIRIYASRRDRFDDPVQPRLPGAWELLVKKAAQDKGFGTPLPANVPTVLAAFTSTGRVLRWTTEARDAAGRKATFYGYAGDHYSGMSAGGLTFCTGCHPGHSGLGRTDFDHAERLK
jgi:hypothetical protein